MPESNGPSVRVVLTTAPSADVAEGLGATVVGERLAACASVVPGITSIYRWEGDSIILAAPRPGSPRPSSFNERSGDVVRLERLPDHHRSDSQRTIRIRICRFPAEFPLETTETLGTVRRRGSHWAG